ncbi:uncharacterized protein [Maniola hyperantus]|uniref:uncharacterized protein isoform X2 n=1 Tax=Aphantopus hyperantus TaxID=2795564 RepID=UPI003747AC84
MTLKMIILLCLVFFLCKAQEASYQPGSTIEEKFMNVGPSTIHSITGKFYEEKQREIDAKHKTYNANVTNLDPVANIGSLLHNVLKNISNTEPPRQDEKVLFRRNKSSNTRENPSEFDVPKKLQSKQVNNLDSTMIFQAENLVSNYDKNNSTETIKKELAFDSLLIKNDFNNNYSMSPTNDIMNSYMNQEINPETDMVHNPSIMMRLDKPGRRFEINPNYGPISHDPFKLPVIDESNIMPITPKFEPTNYDKSTCDDRESDEILERSGNDIQLVNDPTKGLGISNVGKSRVMLMDHPRVCYACSSISDPSCWSPGRTTAVKYCRADHPTCLTKLYKYKGLSYIIRDCGKTCEQDSLGLASTKYTTCTICHHDLCNSAHHFKMQNITILMLLIFHFLILLNVFVN